MKTCPVCALDLDDAYLFCPDDGSILATLPNRSTGSEPANNLEPKDGVAGAAVLYCPACAAEYPLTFSACPVHGVQLIRRQMPRLSNNLSDLRQHDSAVNAQALATGPQLQRDQSKLNRRLTTLDLKRPEVECPRAPAVALSLDDELEHDVASAPLHTAAAAPVSAGGGATFDYRGPATDAHERVFERRGFRVAAIAIAFALGVFGLAAIYTIASNLSRRSSSSAAQIASNTQAAPQPSPFVATPQEAQNYREEEAPVPSASTPESRAERPAERARSESASPSPTEHAVRKPTVAQPLPKPPVPTPQTAPATATRVSNPPLPALPRGESGGFDSRLIRVRSRKTTAGFRYDLTFNMQEQAGRSAEWQRVLISTRSASGMSHSEAIPFSHRLGAAGALTFTISVELTGRSEADWQGRIVCTTLGWDNKGAPLRASFGANVTP